MARLVSVNTGLPRDIQWRGETVHTAIWKQPVAGRSLVRKLNVTGDGQGDVAGHGGENRAVMVYQTDSYRYWEAFLHRADFVYGQFGENFTVDGLSDDEVCIGDRYRTGGAIFEVTQPRVTCYRVGIRMNEPSMAALLVSHRRPGFYFRVIEEGEVGAGDEIVKIAGYPESISVSEISSLLYLPGHPREQLARALSLPALSLGWKTSLRALLDQAPAETGNPGLSLSAGLAPAWSGFKPLRVTRVERESASVISISFGQPDGAPLPAALPGQFLVVRLRVHPDCPTILRNYSMSGAPGADVYRISVKHEVNGAGSSYLHNQVKAGDLLDVSAPRGEFCLKPGGRPIVLLSAGIGATPVLAMLHALAAANSDREVWWLYGARNREDHPFAEESHKLLKKLARGRGHVAYSRPGPEDREGQDYDSHERLSASLLDRLGVMADADFYLCGPNSFLESLRAGLLMRGTPSTQIYTEVFGPAAPITPGIAPMDRPRPHVPAETPGSGPQISFARSGLTVPWSASFGSLLELAEACDVPVRWSCRTGVCHTCETALIGGLVQYRPEPLEAPAAGNVLLCCAQPSGALEIDL